MKTDFVFLVGLMITFQLYAQRNFDPGYIINHESDTIQGSIHYDMGKSAFQKCRMKFDNDSVVMYQPQDIQAYGIDGEKYFRAMEVPLDGSNQHVFLEVAFSGLVNVYYYQNKDGIEQYFIENNEGQLYELKNTVKTIYQGSKTYEVEQKEYVGVLKNVFQDDPQAMRKAEYVTLDNRSLIKIAELYHQNITGNDATDGYKKMFTESDLHVGPLAGIMRMENSITYFRSAPSDAIQTTPIYGLFAQINFPNLMKMIGMPQWFQDQIYLGYEAFMYSNSGDAQRISYSEAPEVTFTVVETFNFSYEAFHHQIYLRYQFNQWKIKPYLQGGFYIQHIRDSDMKGDRVFYYPNGTIYDGNLYSTISLEKDYTGWMAGFGLMIPIYQTHLNINLRIKPPVDLTIDIREQCMTLDLSLSLF